MRTDAPYDFGDDSGVRTGALGDGGGRDFSTVACEYFNLADATKDGGGFEIDSAGCVASVVERIDAVDFVVSVECWVCFLAVLIALADAATTDEAVPDDGGRC